MLLTLGTGTHLRRFHGWPISKGMHYSLETKSSVEQLKKENITRISFKIMS
jgi:hypothetical protein